MSPRDSFRIGDDSGATAIEYGLIAGLIALGLIGSLVTTKGSLNAIFGTASAQMGSASSSGAATGGVTFSGPQALFRTKTLASKSGVTGGNGSYLTRTYTFTDGSTAKVYYGLPVYAGYIAVDFRDPVNGNILVEVGNGYTNQSTGVVNPPAMDINTYNASNTIVSQLTSLYNADDTTSDTVRTYTKGQVSSSQTSVGLKSNYAPYYADYDYIVALTAADR